MALPAATISFPSTSIPTFHDCLENSHRILALLGAGLSAPSNLPTFRGVGNNRLWQNHDPAKLATPRAFADDPILAWRFYQDRRRQALDAQPNAAHVALAELAKHMGNDCCMLSMNIDGLSQRAGHPSDDAGGLLELHGNLFSLKCSNRECDYVEKDNVDRSLIPEHVPDTEIALPKCPRCSYLLRPDIVWFTEPLSSSVTQGADRWIAAGPIDLVLVVGTTAQVWPAAGYVDSAIERGARVAMVDIDRGDLVPGSGELGLTSRDWFFVGVAADLVPAMLEPILK
ncbi:uncharacterized protein LTR77_006768 [Saxophila tyrrhenica]|uniref:Deacetylase sirtuin-type domain-containing protein n=1 Tax=Saxophila tyrrhenica TaxID=1690608 RepID=A0AAV9P652_9PEZI|nr:hypothetical protein LTR77_006768 [Saxophila tyrrhenica]